MAATDVSTKQTHTRKTLDQVTVRFAGDSGDGIQLTGNEFTRASAIAGNDLATYPDFPAEIRAPAGTLAGVSGFQIQFSSLDVHTPGDRPDVLVAFNPAALKANLRDLPKGGLLIVNTDAFTEQGLKKAACETNPLEDGSLRDYRLIPIAVTTLTLKALEGDDRLDHKEKGRAKNFFALGLMYWIYHRPIENTLKWIAGKFAREPAVAEANAKILRAGYNYGEITEVFQDLTCEVPPARLAPGRYRNITGNQALALGIAAAAKLSGLPVVYGSYPITPASEILHELSALKNCGIVTHQAEDEIAAVAAAIGAAYAGALAVTGTSGPGAALKAEAVSLAVMAELPLVIVDVQRAGPSTGLPTKTEQADLLQAIYGRHSEAPACVLAAATPSDCFEMAITAARFALKYMTPVYLLSDGYLAFGSEPWRLPRMADLPKVPVSFRTSPDGFFPYVRDERTLARPWVKPGTPGLEHRIGGLEKSNIEGRVSYDPTNHDLMCRLRAAKVRRIVHDIPPVEVYGPLKAKTLVVGWGSTFGAIRAAVERLHSKGVDVAQAHLRFLNPFPANLGEVLGRYGTVIVPELNLGQLRTLLRAQFLVNAKGVNKLAGQPFRAGELAEAIEDLAAGKYGDAQYFVLGEAAGAAGDIDWEGAG